MKYVSNIIIFNERNPKYKVHNHDTFCGVDLVIQVFICLSASRMTIKFSENNKIQLRLTSAMQFMVRTVLVSMIDRGFMCVCYYSPRTSASDIDIIVSASWNHKTAKRFTELKFSYAQLLYTAVQMCCAFLSCIIRCHMAWYIDKNVIFSLVICYGCHW